MGSPQLGGRHLGAVEHDQVCGQFAAAEADASSAVGVGAQVVESGAVNPLEVGGVFDEAEQDQGVGRWARQEGGRWQVASVEEVVGPVGLAAPISDALVLGHLACHVVEDVFDKPFEGVAAAGVAGFGGVEGEGAQAGENLVELLDGLDFAAGVENISSGGAADGVAVGVHLEEVCSFGCAEKEVLGGVIIVVVVGGEYVFED